MSLCGDGGDVLFAGYERIAAALALERIGRVPAALRRPVAAGMSSIPGRLLGSRGLAVRRLAAQAGAGR